MITAPASRMRDTTGASRVGIGAGLSLHRWKGCVPPVVGTPATDVLSLIATFLPDNKPVPSVRPEASI